MTLALKPSLRSSGRKEHWGSGRKDLSKELEGCQLSGWGGVTAGYRNAFSTKYSTLWEQHSALLIANRTLVFTPAAESKEKPPNGKCSEDGKVQAEPQETEAFEAAQVYRHPMCCVSLFYCCLYHPPKEVTSQYCCYWNLMGARSAGFVLGRGCLTRRNIPGPKSKTWKIWSTSMKP